MSKCGQCKGTGFVGGGATCPICGGSGTAFPDPHVTPTISVPEAGRLLGLGSKTAAYAAVERGEIPIIRLGRKIRVPTAKVLAKLGIPLDQPAPEAAPQ